MLIKKLQDGYFLTTGLPPSVNAAYRTTIVKGRSMVYKSAEAKQFMAEVFYLARRAPKIINDDDKLAVSIYIAYRNGNWDIDNRSKILLDAIEKSGLISNDKHIHQLNMDKLKSSDIDKKVFVFIERLESRISREEQLKLITGSIED